MSDYVQGPRTSSDARLAQARYHAHALQCQPDSGHDPGARLPSRPEQDLPQAPKIQGRRFLRRAQGQVLLQPTRHIHEQWVRPRLRPGQGRCHPALESTYGPDQSIQDEVCRGAGARTNNYLRHLGLQLDLI